VVYAAENVMQLSVSSLRNAVMAIGFLTLVTGCLNERQYDAPTVSVSASPTRAAVDTTVTVTWSSQYAQSCTASGDWSGAKEASGTQTVTVRPGGASPAVNTFTLSCSGRGGNASASATLEIIPLPNVSLSFPSDALPGEAVKLTWSASNATSCSASGNWSGTKATSGNEEPLAPLNSTTETLTYALTCTGPGGTRTNSVSVKYLGFIASKLAGSRLYVTSDALPGYPPGYGGSGAVLEFSGTSTGALLDSDTSTSNGRYRIPRKQSFSWAVENGKLSITYTSPRTSTSFSSIEDLSLDADERAKLIDSSYSQIPVTATIAGITYAKARGSQSNYASMAPSTSASVSRLTVEPIRLRDGSFLTLRRYPVTDQTPAGSVILRAPNEISTTKFACPSVSGSNTVCLGGLTLAGINYTGNGVDATTGQLGPDSFQADLMIFNNDGTLQSSEDEPGQPLPRWTVNTDGTITIRGQDGSAVMRMADFRIADQLATGGLFNGVFLELTMDDGTRGAVYFGLVPIVNESNGSRFTFDSTYPVNASGKYWRAEINNWSPSRGDASGAIRPFDIFGWKFATGGSGASITGESADCNNDGTANETRGAFTTLNNWTISTGTGFNAGLLVTKRNIAGQVRERGWFPVIRGTASNGDRFFYAIEYEDFLGNVGSTPLPEGRTIITPRLSKWIEVPDAWTCTR